MNKKSIQKIIFIGFLACLGFLAKDALALYNPAAIYCKQLGLEFNMKSSGGDYLGTCKMPDGTECEEWAFFTGKCGQKYSYCLKNGMEIKTATGEACSNSFSKDCAVCVSKTGQQTEVVKLMRDNQEPLKVTEPNPLGISSTQAVAQCGNGICDAQENSTNCNQDCKSAAQPTQPGAAQVKSKTNWTLTFLIVLFIALLGTAVIYLYRRFLA